MKSKSERMPVVFLGHGSPMNAIQDNAYTRALHTLGKTLLKPKAIVVVSAHWMTKGTGVTHMPNPKTIHDFHGFPQELSAIQYPASGAPELAEHIQALISEPKIFLDEKWGLDHGTWSVLRHIYPDAKIPVVQISLDMSKNGEYHFALGEKLRPLRQEGVLIVGSGNIVHNLCQIEWDEDAPVRAWAKEFDDWVKLKIQNRDFQPLVTEVRKTESGKMSVPTPDHYLPLLYVLGASDTQDQITTIYDGFQNASISMRCVMFG